MKTKIAALLATGFISTIAVALPPSQLTVINNIDQTTDVQVHGAFTSSPAAPRSIVNFPWPAVTALCDGGGMPNTAVNVCAVEVFAAPNTTDQIDIGTVLINLTTGKVIVVQDDPYQTGISLSSGMPGQVTVSYSNGAKVKK